MASGINCIYMIIFGKFIDLTFKIIAVFTITMQQNYRISLPCFNIKMLNIHAAP